MGSRASCTGVGGSLCLQWCHRLSEMERSNVTGSIFTKTSLQWGHSLPATERPQWVTACTPTRASFNGAIAFRQWRVKVAIRIERPFATSMLPSPFSDGKPRQSVECHTSECHLQWCHRLSAMESSNMDHSVATVPLYLQWCHHLSAMEKMTTASTTSLDYETLQWCHRLSAMESTPSWTRKAKDSTGFNGATACQRWKDAGNGGAQPHHVPASMVPPPFGDGKQSLHVPLGAGRRPSMVPPPFGDGKR